MEVKTSTENSAGSNTSALGNKIYQEKIRPLLTEDDIGKYVIVDVNTGEYEIDEHAVAAGIRLKNRMPKVRSFTLRVGFSAAYFFGWHEDPRL